MSELWVLMWSIGVFMCQPDGGKLCRGWTEAYEYEMYQSSTAAMIKYDELFELNKNKPFEYKLYKIESEWLVEPKPKEVFHNLKLLRRQGVKP